MSKWRSKSIARREILGTAAGTMFLAPLLAARRAAADLRVPRRLITLFTPNASPPEFFPTGSGRSFALDPQMQAFAGLEPHLLFARPINHTIEVGNSHETGVLNCFTGAHYTEKNGEFDQNDSWATGPSIDQIAATRIAGESPIKNVVIATGIQDGNEPQNGPREFISYSGPSQPVPGESDPRKIFSTLFGSGVPAPVRDDAAAARQARVRAESLNVSIEELQEIRKFLGKEEMAKLDLHVTSIQGLAKEAAALAASGMCRPIDRTGWPLFTGLGGGDKTGAAFERVFNCYAEMIATAFECDRTRVAALQVGYGGAHWSGFLDNSGGKSWHVDIAHALWVDQPGVGPLANKPDVTAAYRRIHRYLAGLVASLAKRLDSIRVPGGTMLDNTIIVWGTEMGVNHTHNGRDVPYLVIGGRGMGLQTGQFLTFDKAKPRPVTQLLTGILNALGVEAKGIGNQPVCGSLTGMLS